MKTERAIFLLEWCLAMPGMLGAADHLRLNPRLDYFK